MKVERSEERGREHRWAADEAANFLASWCRVADKDGSTVAYAPDATTAQRIADALDSATSERDMRQEIESLKIQRDTLAEALEVSLVLLADSFLSASQTRQREIQVATTAAQAALRAAGRLGHEKTMSATGSAQVVTPSTSRTVPGWRRLDPETGKELPEVEP